MRLLTIDVGIKNLSYCLVDLVDGDSQVTIVDWDCSSSIDPDVNTKKCALEDLTEATLALLSKRFDGEEVIDLVVIENQPMMLNGLMKSIAMVIYTYFNMVRIQQGTVGRVVFTNATNKLKVVKNKGSVATKLTYAQRKKRSIQLAREYLLDIAPDRIVWFDGLKKADDYGDTLLYALYVAENRKAFAG